MEKEEDGQGKREEEQGREERPANVQANSNENTKRHERAWKKVRGPDETQFRSMYKQN